MHQFIVFPDLLSAQFTVHATLFFVRLEIAEIPSHYGTSMALPFDNLSGIGTIICFLFGHARLIFLVGTLISSITRWLHYPLAASQTNTRAAWHLCCT